MMNIEEINKLLPQKPPFLMIDRVVEIDPGKKLVAIKNVTINDQILQVHFPGKPIMPGSLIIESMAQTAILLFQSKYNFKMTESANYYLGSVKAHFFKPVYPGDQLRIEAVTVRLLPNGSYVEMKAYVGESKVAESDLVTMIEK